ncbi:MAG: hypothetical protein Q4A79_02160 [Candidatus Saccharibacteria bacterium]|nr:hypothetical protein [Candidatus Saccharibacteria bacterium]
MNVAEWILVVILSVTFFIFLVIGIILMIRMLNITDEVKKVIMRGQDIADNANGVVSNVKGLTSVGGTIELLVDKYLNPKLKKKGSEQTKKAKEQEEAEED